MNNSMNAQLIRDALTPNHIVNLLKHLGADTYEDRTGDVNPHFIFPTICHNPHSVAKSMKLYYYLENKLFMCWTGCGKAFDIFSLVSKVKLLNDHKITTFSEAVTFVQTFCDIDPSKIIIDYSVYASQYIPRANVIKPTPYSENSLYPFINYHASEWKQEGITDEAFDRFGIKFWFDGQRDLFDGGASIIIPQRYYDGSLIGIRQRILGRAKNKYLPIKIEGTTYSCALSTILYGAYENRKAIQKSRQVVVFEGEKSVLKHYSLYGEASNAVACYGKVLHRTQIIGLINSLDVRQVVIAFDKEYEEVHSEKGKEYYQYLYEQAQRNMNYAGCSFLYDNYNLLKEKDSPIDRGKETYETLFQDRTTVRSG